MHPIPAESLTGTITTDSLTVRAASVIGTEHQARGQVRQDAFAMAPGPMAGSVVVAVADGLGSTARAEEAAARAVASYVELLGRLTSSVASALIADEVSWSQWAAHAAKAVAERLSPVSVGESPARAAATTISAALVVPGERTTVAWTIVGDSPVLVAEDGALTAIWDPPRSNVTTALPQHPDAMACGLDAIGPGAGLLLLSDGMADVLLGVPGLAEQLTLVDTESGLLPLLRTGVPGCHDDRTALVVTRNPGD